MPHILGADGAGVVVETGAKVENVKVGDAVCLYPPTGCGQCEFCRTERDFMCIRLRVLGERIEGTYAQYVKLPGQNCFPIPNGLFIRKKPRRFRWCSSRCGAWSSPTRRFNRARPC